MKYQEKLIIFYLSLGPINWLPFVAPAIVNSFKYLLFSILLIQALRVKKKIVTANLDLRFFLFFIIMMTPAIVQGRGNIYLNILDIVFIFMSAFIIGNLNIDIQKLFFCFRSATIIVGLFALFAVVLPWAGLNIKSPEPWESPLEIGGFGGYRTGWSNSTFLFVPFAIFSFKRSSKYIHKIFLALAVIFILITQLNSGGRAGLIASLLSCLFLFRTNKFLLLGFLVALSAVYTTLGREFFENKFRISDEFIERKAGSSDLDKISSGRTSEYEAGIKAAMLSPVFGYGFNKVDDVLFRYGVKEDVHNTFLKRFLEGGILFIIPIICLFFFLFRAGYKNKIMWRDHSMKNLFMCYAIFSLMISFFEPNYLIGSFQGESFFWFVMLAFVNQKGFIKLKKRMLAKPVDIHQLAPVI